MKHCLTVNDFSPAEIQSILAQAAKTKAEVKAGVFTHSCQDKTLAMMFEKDSLRTRLSFETGIQQLGGNAVHIAAHEIKMGKREPIEDVARVMSRMVDIIMIRTYGHHIIEQFAQNSTVPVINGLTDDFHPCQSFADALTIQEHLGDLSKVTLLYIGDGNNVANSLVLMAKAVGMTIRVATPTGYELDWERLSDFGVSPDDVTCSTNVADLVSGANVLYTDVWTSMGQEAEKETRLKDFQGFQINEDLIDQAAPEAIVLHCLPAHRGEEISAGAMEHPRCVVFDQAENRLHAQKAIMDFLLHQA